MCIRDRGTALRSEISAVAQADWNKIFREAIKGLKAPKALEGVWTVDDLVKLSATSMKAEMKKLGTAAEKANLIVGIPTYRWLPFWPPRRYAAHEFGHIAMARLGGAKEFTEKVWLPYNKRVIRAMWSDYSEAVDAFLTAGDYATRDAAKTFWRAFRRLCRAHKAAKEVRLTCYSLTNPIEGYAEAFSFYVTNPRKLKKIWPEAYDFFYRLERSWKAR